MSTAATWGAPAEQVAWAAHSVLDSVLAIMSGAR